MPGLEAPSHWVIIAIVVIVLFGYKKLPEMSRSLGRSLRIFKTEMKGLSEDDNARQAETTTGTATTGTTTTGVTAPVAPTPPPVAGPIPPAPTAAAPAPAPLANPEAPAPIYPAQNGHAAQPTAASQQLGA